MLNTPAAPARRARRLAALLPPARAMLFCLLLALGVTFVCEALSRHSPLDALLFIVRRPHAFLYNALLVLCCLSLALFFTRRAFAYSALGGVWVLLGCVNCVTCALRITPLSFYDFVVFVNNATITSSYVSYLEILLIAVGAAAITAGYIWMFRHAKRAARFRRRALVFTALLCALAVACTVPYAVFNDDFADPMAAYDRYGFEYSLLRSMVDRGVSRPADYGEDAIDGILQNVGDDLPGDAAADKPNIIILQLESFLDPANITNVACSEDPVPNFSRLKRECTSGFLHVPMIGGGTANVEFEVVTGMNLSDFGTGEYPYSTVLQSETCETVAFDLKSAGYVTHAIHNHDATFYDRDTVFSRLGFDTFTSIEYMHDVTKNPLGWCRDEVLTQCILDALNSTAGRDFAFAVSVQGHGKYPAEAPEAPYAITSAGFSDPAVQNEFDYYINQLHDTDQFLGELLDALEAYPEPVVLAVYGDHLPSLAVSSENLLSGSLLTTEYALWSNDGSLQKQDRALSAYQLSAYTLDRCGIDGGVLLRYHQQRFDQPDYLEKLQVIEYDMLYGDKLLYAGSTPYPPTDMRMGVKDICVKSVNFGGGVLFVTGEEFTPYSVVYLGERALDTTYISPTALVAVPPITLALERGAAVAVCQVATDGTVLSRSEDMAYAENSAQ